jgi:ferredoxin
MALMVVPLVETESLNQFDSDWPSAIGELAGAMHPVDRDACLIWLQFFPLGLYELLQTTPDRAILEQFYQFRGSYRLADVADTSHHFLYGHRYWPAIKQALSETARELTLAETIRAVAAKVQAPLELTLPITAIGVMTLRQTGPAFLQKPYEPPIYTRTAEEVIQLRSTGSKKGWLFRSKPRVTMNERQPDGWFPLIAGQHITTAAELDKRPHHETNVRCSVGNGPIPVDCRSGTCGTCWVGILGGRERLTPVDDFERKRMDYFGYWESPFHNANEARPLIRLACQSIASGSCSIVIPWWNGVWGKSRRAAFNRR